MAAFRIKHIVVLTFLLAFGNGCAKPPAGINASQLYKEFSKNKAEAQAKYEGQIITIHGKVAVNSKRDFNRQIELQVEGSDNPEANMLCAFRATDPKADQALDRFKKGDIIVLKGRCRGIWQSGKTGKDSAVVIEECELVE
jgi:hypothetical protein